MGRKGPWPKGLPRKGWKESGLSFEEWKASHVAEEVKPEPVVASVEVGPSQRDPDELSVRGVFQLPSGAYRWKMEKDEWGRQMIKVYNPIGDVVAHEQRRVVNVEKQAQEMLQGVEHAVR